MASPIAHRPSPIAPEGVCTMRKLLTASVCTLLITGIVVAAEVTLVKYDPEKKAVTVKEGDVEKTYHLTDKTKVYVVRDGKAEHATVDTAIKVLSSDRAKGKLKFELTSDKDAIAEMKLRPRKGK
jgi:hypothetical protein